MSLDWPADSWPAYRRLAQHLEICGEVSSYPPAIHYQAVGSYDNALATFEKLEK
jgi:hypothetical protein